MDETNRNKVIHEYVRSHALSGPPNKPTPIPYGFATRIEKAFSLLPQYALDLFLLGGRDLRMVLDHSPGFPFGMKTSSSGTGSSRTYTITFYEEHGSWQEDLFLGSLLRELGHVAAGRPPENEWPLATGDRARFREALECRADSMVWRWGLKDYSMIHLNATYPSQWVERIVQDIENLLDREIAAG
jgi:hypothetical protein